MIIRFVRITSIIEIIISIVLISIFIAIIFIIGSSCNSINIIIVFKMNSNYQ